MLSFLEGDREEKLYIGMLLLSVRKVSIVVCNALLEKWFPLHGERAHSLYSCIYITRLEVSKNNRNVKEEETELLI